MYVFIYYLFLYHIYNILNFSNKNNKKCTFLDTYKIYINIIIY